MPAISVVKARGSWKASNEVARLGSGDKAAAPSALVRIVSLLFAVALLTRAYSEEGGRPKTGNPLWGIPLVDLRMTVERPLFSPSRRPPPPPLAAPPVVASPLPPPRPVEPERPAFTRLGTIIGERIEIAVFLDEVTKDVVYLKAGQDRGGWTLKSVRGRQIDFEKNYRTARLAFNPEPVDQRRAKPQAEKSQADVAALSNPDMESYRAALRQRRGR